MLKLLSGCNCLRVFSREDHKCILCNVGEDETVEHFVMYCGVFSTYRDFMMAELYNSVDVITKTLLLGLPRKILFYMLLGMDYPISTEMLLVVHRTSC